MEIRQMPTLTEVNQTIETYLKLENRGDDLAQVIKENLVRCLTPVVDGKLHKDRIESVVEVAMRLGYTISKNFDGALGAYVKSQCEDKIVGTRITKADVSGKRVSTNMYPFKDHEVEEVVRCYCEQKGFERFPVITDLAD